MCVSNAPAIVASTDSSDHSPAKSRIFGILQRSSILCTSSQTFQDLQVTPSSSPWKTASNLISSSRAWGDFSSTCLAETLTDELCDRRTDTFAPPKVTLVHFFPVASCTIGRRIFRSFRRAYLSLWQQPAIWVYEHNTTVGHPLTIPGRWYNPCTI